MFVLLGDRLCGKTAKERGFNKVQNLTPPLTVVKVSPLREFGEGVGGEVKGVICMLFNP
ncbi:hypothetical protein [Scytonema sp. HK-05]|uniref:hypothetical protein n=1 Tax=Scytonema sp. HK-05 TaxID=1137095 RepID=UPI001E2BDDA4|nr:hypothetical protein [Scytonema sp. HK-05]